MSYILFYSKSKNLDHRYLSNFQVIDRGIVIDEKFPFHELHGKCFHSIENAFQASKLCCAKFDTESLDIIQTLSPLEAKKFGSKSNFKKHKKELDVISWNKMSIQVMKKLLKLRYDNDEKFKKTIEFAKNNQLKLKHFEITGSKSFWGGFYKDCEWKGTNMLGELMQELK
tara:strand:- start:6 stop:515 length:510 start_codon:yes stop_codon:yes gene_type:complete